MNMFSHCKTAEDLKKAYCKAAMENHPDRGGSTDKMQKVNADYEQMFARLKDIHTAPGDDKTAYTAEKSTAECPEEFINIISSLCKLDGLIVELVGRWIWISGNTKDNKEELKKLGCQWARKKAMWYWHSADDATGKHTKQYSIDDIRTKYGSTRYSSVHMEYLG